MYYVSKTRVMERVTGKCKARLLEELPYRVSKAQKWKN